MSNAAPSRILVWDMPMNYPQEQIGQIVRGSGTDRFEFRKGVRLENVECPRIDFKKLDVAKYDFYPNDADLILVSQKMLGALQELCPDDFQDIPANVYVAGKKFDGMFLINVVSCVAAIDKELSEFEEFSGTNRIRSFSKLSFQNDALSGRMLARAEEYKSFVLVARELALSLKEKSIRGVSFTDPSEMFV